MVLRYLMAYTSLYVVLLRIVGFDFLTRFYRCAFCGTSSISVFHVVTSWHTSANTLVGTRYLAGAGLHAAGWQPQPVCAGGSAAWQEEMIGLGMGQPHRYFSWVSWYLVGWFYQPFENWASAERARVAATAIELFIGR